MERVGGSPGNVRHQRSGAAQNDSPSQEARG